jgi:F-type H+-transporting ATPase subunit b
MVLAFAEGSSIQLVPDGTIIIHIALILIMIWILNRTFFRPINKVLTARDRNKGGHSSEAEETLKLVDSKLAQYNAATREARTEGYQLIEGERAAAVADREAKIEAVKTEAGQRIESEKAELQSQTEAARQTLAAEAQKMAEKISANILKS